MEAEGRIAQQVGGRGYYAKVNVNYESSPDTVVELAEEVLNNERYQKEGWLDAAIAGVRLGLLVARVTGNCSITRVHGMVVDTSSSLVALAGVKAVWQAVGYTPSPQLLERFDNCVLRSHRMITEALIESLTAAESSSTS